MVLFFILVNYSLFHTAIPENTQILSHHDLSSDRLIFVHSHCQWFSVIRACVHTHLIKPRERHASFWCDMYDAYHSTKLTNNFSFSADSEKLPDLCFILVCTFFLVNSYVLSKLPVKESHDNVRHQPVTPFMALVVHTALILAWD